MGNVVLSVLIVPEVGTTIYTTYITTLYTIYGQDHIQSMVRTIDVEDSQELYIKGRAGALQFRFVLFYVFLIMCNKCILWS